ncbi:MAG: rod shape-determining protein RodA [Chloroflexota bacterium]
MIAPRLRLDYWVILSPLCLVAIGILLQYSAAHPLDISEPLLSSQPVRHGIYALAGVVAGLAVARVDYRSLGTLAPALYVGSLVLLVLVLLVGHSANEVRRWIHVGLFPVQPSEIAKVVTVLALARFWAAVPSGSIRIQHTLLSIAMVAAPLGLVYIQPDLGSAFIFLGIWTGMAFAAGVPVRHFLLLGGGALASIPAVIQFVLHGYMQDRLRLFMNPGADPLGAGYNVLQSEISVGSGGFWGKGLFNGTQNQLDFHRVQQTDFVFSVLGEELGFIGAMLVFSLFVVLLFRGLRIALLARDGFGRLIATGFVMILLVQVFINVGVNIRLLPVTGIPLPFLSFGGTSLLTALFSLGILQSVYMRRERSNW